MLLAAFALLPGAATALPDVAIDLSAQAAAPVPAGWALRQDYSGVDLLDIRAPALSAAERTAISRQRRGPALVGAGQAVPDAHQGELSTRLEWNAAPGGGFVAAFQVSAPEAKALRIGLRGNLPAGGAVRFFSPADASQRFEPYRQTDFLPPAAQGRAKAKAAPSAPPVDGAGLNNWATTV
ncbi:MAG: hypothetical protein OXG51_13520, partial [Gammaproteobacteria bacterium]|nr:hypothetical protein [Gammaproteobacteria bacterium]